MHADMFHVVPRETDRQTHRDRDRETETERQTDRQTETDRRRERSSSTKMYKDGKYDIKWLAVFRDQFSF